MKNIIILIFVFISLTINAQENLNTLTLTPIVFDENSNHEQVSESVKNLLKNKMRQVASKYGFSSGILKDKHIMFPDIQVITKDVIPSAPPMISLNVEITFYIADYDTRMIYASEIFEVKGVGDSETKAYNNAISKIDSNNQSFRSFMENGKQKIINYYNTQCDVILNTARTKSQIGEEDLALSMLTRIPNDCDVCFNKSLDLSVEIYKKIEEKICNENFSKAQSVWVTNKSYEGAMRMEPYLSKILPTSPCYNDTAKLIFEMTKFIKEKEGREWNYNVKKEKDEYEIRKMQIKLAHEVAIEKIRNQPEVIYRYWW